MSPMDLAFREVGLAVLRVQRLEAALAPIYETFKIVTIDGHFERFKGLIPDSAWRMPLTALVNELELKGKIDAAFAARLRAFAESRHTLVHRWFIQHGWPGDDLDAPAYAHLTELALSVATEAHELTKMVGRYMLAACIGYGDLRLEDMFLRVLELSGEEIRTIDERLAHVREHLGSDWVGGVPKGIPLVTLLSPGETVDDRARG